jgi:hypothetical protein
MKSWHETGFYEGGVHVGLLSEAAKEKCKKEAGL